MLSGIQISFGSYYRDTIIVAFVNCVSSILSGFTVFSILGFMAHITNQDVENVVDQGKSDGIRVMVPRWIQTSPSHSKKK